MDTFNGSTGFEPRMSSSGTIERKNYLSERSKQGHKALWKEP